MKFISFSKFAKCRVKINNKVLDRWCFTIGTHFGKFIDFLSTCETNISTGAIKDFFILLFCLACLGFTNIFILHRKLILDFELKLIRNIGYKLNNKLESDF